MAYVEPHAGGFRAVLYVRTVRRRLWLGHITKSAARQLARHLEALNIARDTGTAPPLEAIRWTQSVCPRIQQQLAAFGLISQLPSASITETTLRPFLDAHISSRTDLRPRSISRLENAARHLVDRLGPAAALSAVTPADADRFARWVRATFAHSHAGKLISDARQLFGAAIRERIIHANPFDAIDSSQRHQLGREAYITAADTAAIIALADPFFAALIACARFGGLRVPSEPLALEWSHVNWESSMLTVTSPKTHRHTPTRVIPLFPALEPHLRHLSELAPPGSLFVFDRNRSTAAKVWRGRLESLITRAGVPKWPKLWQNLRASCRSDLEAQLPGFVVDAWMGHSAHVGRKHYTRVNDSHFAAATHGAIHGAIAPTTADAGR